MAEDRTIKALIAGATGYVGGRLVGALVDEGVKVRCLARTPAKLDRAPWRDAVEVVRGAVGEDLTEALAGVDVAVYLVHSIGAGEDWELQEVRDATNFGQYAKTAGVKRIVYLGGLGRDTDALSPHLQSRHAVGRALRASGVDVAELRAGVIIGSGSASFEMLRYLVEILPFMVTPRWVKTNCQPIGIGDVVEILVRAICAPSLESRTYEIGGADVVSYVEMMQTYAEVAGLKKRRLLTVPLLTPRLSSHWVGLVTPVPQPLSQGLVESLINEVVASDNAASSAFGVYPVGVREAISRALAADIEGSVPTYFLDADLRYFAPSVIDPEWAGGTTLSDVRTERCDVGRQTLYETICGIGGERGWYAGQWLWSLRGILDKALGGPGLRKGRKPTIHVGESIDFWRVEELIPNRRVRFRAEMVLPGTAWLTWELGDESGQTVVTQRATFRPRGVLGRIYWYAVAPFHRFVFPGMLHGLVEDAASRGSSTAP